MYTPPRTVGYPRRAHPTAASHRKPLDRGHHESPQRKPHGRANVPTKYPSEIFRQEMSECSIDSPADQRAKTPGVSVSIDPDRRCPPFYGVSAAKPYSQSTPSYSAPARFTSARTSTPSTAQRFSTNLIPTTVRDDFLSISLPLRSEIASWPFIPPIRQRLPPPNRPPNCRTQADHYPRMSGPPGTMANSSQTNWLSDAARSTTWHYLY